MKFLAILLSVFMLAMAFDICPDTDSCEDSDKTELSNKTEQQSEGSDFCNPFCHCLRCPFSVLLPAKQAGLFSGHPSPKKYAFTSDSIILSVKRAVWQPPKAA